MSDSVYTRYIQCIERHLHEEVLTFKSDPDYRYMLEHEHYQSIGFKYLKMISFVFSEDEILKFTTLNDSIGQPICEEFIPDFPKISPTSLRYVYHAYKILSYIESLGITRTSITELGGGYGGLCMAIHIYAPKFNIHIDSYHIIDLELPTKLQRRVLDELGFRDVVLHTASTYGSDVPDGFFVSAYAFSEIESCHQQEYIKTLFPKMNHGFIVWNSIPVYDFGKKIQEEDELPLTFPENKFVYF